MKKALQKEKRRDGHRLWTAVLAGCIAVAATCGTGHAHGVRVFAYVADGTVYVESKFSGGRTAKDARIEVLSPDGRQLLEGRTRADGTFSFPVPQPTALLVVLHAGPGHRAQWRLEEAEVREAGTATDRTPHAEAAPAAGGQDRPAAGLTPEEVEAIVERALEKRLKPVMAMLSDARNPEPGIRDIIGGIGYIIGLVGLAAYLSARRRTRSGDRRP